MKNEVNRDMSFSMYIESKDSNQNNGDHYTFIEKRPRLKWVDSSSVVQCSNCPFKFGYAILGAILGDGKHHCRCCGRVLCEKCSSKTAIIPPYVEVPIPDFKDKTAEVRVCEPCFKKVNKIKNLENLVIIFNLIDLDIYDFRALREATLLPNVLFFEENSSSSSNNNDNTDNTDNTNNNNNNNNSNNNDESRENHEYCIIKEYKSESGNNGVTLIDSMTGSNFKSRTHHIKQCDTCGMTMEKVVLGGLLDNQEDVFDCGNHILPCKICSKKTRIRSVQGEPFCKKHFNSKGHLHEKSGKTWNQVINYHLSKIFEMQYYLPNHRYTYYDVKNLWSNRYNFVGHSKWMVQFLRSINFQSLDGLEKIVEVKKLMSDHLNNVNSNGNRKKMCWNLMCTRDCVDGFIPGDAVQLLNDVGVPELRKVVIECLDKAPREELLCYLQLLVHYVPFENVRLDKAILGNYLIRKASEDSIIANELYWLLRIHVDCKKNSRSVRKASEIYEYFLQEWIRCVPDDIKEVVFSGSNFIHVLEKEGAVQHRFNIVENYKKVLAKIGNVVFPTNPENGPMNIDIENISVKNSITRPIVIPGISGGTETRILYKNEDVRKDKIMMDLIRLMNRILTDELGIDLNIVTYNVLPTSATSGLIEMVNKSDTLYSITKKGVSLLNYALEHNENAVVMELRKKFVRSCASYCVITFLLGIGDRHLENIMMTKDGQLFHIDYGFVLGYEPKLLEVPMMRISSEMINALGGQNSKYYEEFKVLCNQIYTTLRRHVNLFYSILSLLVDLEPPVQNSVPFREKKLVEEIMKRFVPGEGAQEAKIQLDTRISNSTQSYRHTVHDFFHSLAQENTAVKSISKFFDKIREFAPSHH